MRTKSAISFVKTYFSDFEGYYFTVLDNLFNANKEGLRRVQEITQVAPERIRFYDCDLCDYDGNFASP